MKAKTLLFSMIAIFAVALFAMQASAAQFAEIDIVSVNGVNTNQFDPGLEAGETVPVRVYFTGKEDIENVYVSIRLDGHPSTFQTSNEMVVRNGSTYSVPFTLRLPSEVEFPEETFNLIVKVESQSNTNGHEKIIPLVLQRESNRLRILSAEMSNEVKAGKSLQIDVVLQNLGFEEAERNFVTARIPQLGISTTAFFDDLTPEDQNDPDKEDTIERRLFLNVPANTPAGVYTLEIEAYNSDASTETTRKIVVLGTKGDSQVVSSTTSKTFAVGEEQTYSLTLVNAGDTIQVYRLVFDAPEGLTVTAEDTVVAVSAGSSKTVQVKVSSAKEGTYSFGVSVESNGESISRESFTANVKGSSAQLNATVLLTVILAIIFVVLVVVLIVLLTRRPEKKEELGESYY